MPAKKLPVDMEQYHSLTCAVTRLKFWNKLKNMEVCSLKSDYWKSCKKFVPKEKRLQTKAETFTVGSCSSRIRQKFKRKTKYCGKAEDRISEFLNSLMMKLNNKSFILN